MGAIKPGGDGLGLRSSSGTGTGTGTGAGAGARVEEEEEGGRVARGRKGLWEKRGEVLEGILEEVRFLR